VGPCGFVGIEIDPGCGSRWRTPDELRRELADALVALDTERIDALIGRVAERDAALGQALRRHVDTLDDALIEEALQDEA
jgi:hypothetical protein